jgi:hypothetical protein
MKPVLPRIARNNMLIIAHPTGTVEIEIDFLEHEPEGPNPVTVYMDYKIIEPSENVCQGFGFAAEYETSDPYVLRNGKMHKPFLLATELARLEEAVSEAVSERGF